MQRINSSANFAFQKIAAGMPEDLSLTQGNRREEARKWLREAARRVSQVDAPRFHNNSNRERKIARIQFDNIGQMFMFWYDAKLKDELPFWDRFPLIYPIEIYKDGFLGINLHYLPPMYRARLMDQLYTVMNNDKMDRTTRLRIRYRILKSASKFRLFKPCIKRYLNSHVQSQFVRIEPTEWDMAMMLPTERFQKKKREVVWADSLQKLGIRPGED